MRRATQVLAGMRAYPCAVIRRVIGPRCRPIRRIAARVAVTGSDVRIIAAVSERIVESGSVTWMRLNTGDAKRRVISSESGRR